MSKKVKKTIEFVNTNVYNDLMGDAKRNGYNIGDFIIMLHKKWKKK